MVGNLLPFWWMLPARPLESEFIKDVKLYRVDGSRESPGPPADMAGEMFAIAEWHGAGQHSDKWVSTFRNCGL